MRDWELDVSERMSGLKLCAEARADVVRELASHFEQIYDEARENGAGEQQARARALSSVPDWRRFGREVQYEKETLMTTTPLKRTVVYPGLLSAALSAIAMFASSMLSRNGAQYVFQVVGEPRTYFVFNIPWLVALPVAGAAGAWMSWRYGGTVRQRVFAALFPHAVLFGALLFLLLLAAPASILVQWFLGIGPHLTPEDFSIAVWAFRLYTLFTPWVIVPAIASIIGAAPIICLKSHQEEKPPVQAAHA